MKNDFINLTEENVSDEHLCCIIRSRKSHPGITAKREWLSDRLKEGHVFRKLNVKGTVFIEYAPLETAWVPVEGNQYYYIYCLWAVGEYKGKGYGKQLLEYCIADAKANKKSGICVLEQGSRKPGSQIKPLYKVMDFKSQILLKAAISCWHYLLTVRCPVFVHPRNKSTFVIRS